MAGSSASPWESFNKPKPIAPTTPNMPFGSPGNFQAAAATQASDYDKIMSGYDDLIKSAKTTGSQAPATFNPIAPTLTQYQPSSDTNSAMGNLAQLSSSGGYTPEGIANIRERSISPIRSIYANAQRNLERSKALTGGYSPGYTAASGKMARELSEQIGATSTNVEAGIAENQARNRLSIAPSYASFAGEQDRMRASTDASNAEAINKTNEINQQLALQYENMNRQFGQTQQSDILAAVEGKRGLYGTTPALVNTFGGQVATAGQLGQGQQQINNQKKQQAYNAAGAMVYR